MAVTTRAGAKRKNDDTSTGKTTKAEWTIRTDKSEDAMQNRSHLLELPPELRNRIYDFASEGDRISAYGTRVWTSSLPEPWPTRGWQFFALTQTCRQIREEYRPLWIRARSLWVSFRELGRFVDTFMPTEASLKHAPKMIQVAWFHENNVSSEKRWDITPLIRILAYCPDFNFDFIPYRLAMNMVPEFDGICDYCMERMALDEQDVAITGDFYDLCDCVPHDWDYEGWEIHQYNHMAYMENVQSVAQNKDPGWLHAVRNGDITVEFFKKSGSGRIMIVIHYKSCFFLDKHQRKATQDLLHKWGLLGSSNGFRPSRDYIVSFESKKVSISRSGCYETTETLKREVCLTKAK